MLSAILFVAQKATSTYLSEIRFTKRLVFITSSGISLATIFPIDCCANISFVACDERQNRSEYVRKRAQGSGSQRILRITGGIALGFAAVLSQSCGLFQRADSEISSTTAPQQLPFHQQIERDADESSRPLVPPPQKSVQNTPLFASATRSQTIPAGTLVSMRLQRPLLLSRLHATDGFAGFIAAPLLVNGHAVIENGVPVTGRIESTQPPPPDSCLKSVPAYVRLGLNTITVDGSAIPLQTYSLFAKATLIARARQKSRSCEYQLQKNHLLTFRLLAPVTVAEPQALAQR
jgi:hypothetical protein